MPGGMLSIILNLPAPMNPSGNLILALIRASSPMVRYEPSVPSSDDTSVLLHVIFLVKRTLLLVGGS